MVFSDAESSVIEISSEESPFEPQEGDEEVLWTVLQITDERQGMYKVKWAGVDPKTGKAWPQSWVAKHDVTDDLRHMWKIKQAKKKGGKEKKTKKRDTAASKKSRASKAPSTSSTTTLRQRGQSTATPIGEDSDDDSMPPPRPPATKRKHSSTSTSNSMKEFKDDPDTESTSRPTKKRKLEVETKPKRTSSAGKGKQKVDSAAGLTLRIPPLPAREGRPARGSKSRSRTEEQEESTDDEMRVPTPIPPPKDKGKGKQRADPDSEVEVASDADSLWMARLWEVLKNTPTDSDESDDLSVSKEERNGSTSAKKPQFQKGKPKPSKTTAKTINSKDTQDNMRSLAAFFRTSTVADGKRKNGTPIIAAEGKGKKREPQAVAPRSDQPGSKNKNNGMATAEKSNPDSDVVESTSLRPAPKSIPKGKEKDDRSPDVRSCSPVLSPRAQQRLLDYDREVLTSDEQQGPSVIPPILKTPPAIETEPAALKVPLFLTLTPESGYHDDMLEDLGGILRTPSNFDQDELGRKLQDGEFQDDEDGQGGGLEDELQDVESDVGELAYPDQMEVDYSEPVQPEEEIIPAKPTATTSKPNGMSRGQTPEDLTGRIADVILRTRTNIPRIRKESPNTSEIVPETETESNRNTESQGSQSQPQPLAKVPLPSIVVPLTTPRSERLISKMMPRSPHSRGGPKILVIDEEGYQSPDEIPFANDDASEEDDEDLPVGKDARARFNGFFNPKKLLRPIPVMSPSAFTAHLPSSSLIESAVDPAEQEDEPISSIEQFDSPNKVSSSIEDPSGVAQRGRELAEAAGLERLKELGGEQEKQTRISLDEIKARASRRKGKEREGSAVLSHASGSRARSRSKFQTSAKNHAEEDGHVEDDDIRADPDYVPDEETQPEADDSEPRKMPSFEEEEESTQDLLQEQLAHQEQQQQGVVEDVDVLAGLDAPAADHADDGRNEQRHDDEQPQAEEQLVELDLDAEGKIEDDIPDFSMERPTSPPLILELDDEPSLPLPPAKSRSRSGSKSSRGSSDKHKRQSRELTPEPEIPATNSTRHGTPPPPKAPEVEVEVDDERPHLEMAMSLLNKKSAEIYEMEQLMTAEQDRNTALLLEMAALREQLARASSQPTGQHLEEAEATLASERTKWEEERATLNATVKRAMELKESAETDRDFFRAEHSKASSYVLSVRTENMELEKRAEIAEGQAKAGVATVRAVFQTRLETLQKDAREWRMQATFMREKIDRTNDDIRRRAAEEPELRARCEDLDEELDALQEQISDLDGEVKGKNEQIMHLQVEVENWKQEAARLSDDLAEANAKLEYLGKRGLTGAELNGNGHEFVYRCEWREDGPCQAVFLKRGDLRNHMFSAGHLN